ncbi:glycosyltransferase family 4 protein [Cerasicoccus fimbriatus]|uniref:glycosyltransferase family 4 protein n=1 Tax=Cerasicoccus fimbriatus TaxID=3014554 RepID=UPI0022B4F80F|nr:glycosyltransferase [Cerasicoccus sp. TK19100]
MVSEHKPRVLVIAEAANPRLTSVALIGYSLTNALREVADVQLATELRNRDSILEAGFPADQLIPVDNRKMQGLAFKVAKFLRGGESLGWTIYSAFYNVAYPVFERKLWHMLESRLKSGEFDLVHRVTPLSPTNASPIAKRLKQIGVPFIIGPLNGGVPWPAGFDAIRRQEKEWLSYVRGAYKFTPGLQQTRDRASALILASGHTYGEVVTTDARREKAIYIPENAIDPARFPMPQPKAPSKMLKLAFVGRLVPYKGAVTLLEAALPLLKSRRAQLDIIGDGAEMGRLKELVAQHQLESCVSLPGWIAHEKLHERLCASDVFAFPSVREFGGGVVLEAMALGLAPVIADYAGPTELLPDDCGWRVKFESADQLRAGFTEVLTQLADQPEEVRAAGDRACQFVRANFTWPAKARQIRAVYDWTLQSAHKPQFAFAFNPEHRA